MYLWRKHQMNRTSNQLSPNENRPWLSVPVITDPNLLVDAANRLGGGTRHLLGIVGPPGAGKSTLAAWLVAQLAPAAALFPMDGFHLANSELERLGRVQQKGAPNTFDIDGFVAALKRVRRAGSEVYLPEYRRGRINEPIAGALRIPADTRLIVVEGNYLLHEEGRWAAVAELIDECWYVDTAPRVREERLVKRQLSKGRTVEAAVAWATGSDARNAELVTRSRRRASKVVSGTLGLFSRL